MTQHREKQVKQWQAWRQWHSDHQWTVNSEDEERGQTDASGRYVCPSSSL